MRIDRFDWAETRLLGLAAALAFVVGVGFRLYHAASVPLWLDEAYSAYAADHGFAFLWREVPRYETHPPFYYSLVRLWSFATGTNLGARRALGIITGVAAVPLVAFAGDRLAALAGWDATRRRWLIAFAVMLAALHPLSIEMAKQVRPYPVMIAAYALAMLAVLRLGTDARDGRPFSRSWLTAATIAEAALLWLHALGPLFGGSVAIALAVLTLRPGMTRRDLLALAATQIVAGLLYLPALLITLGQAPTWTQSTWLRFLPSTLPDEFALLYANWHRGAPTLALLVALAGLAMLARRGGWGARAALALAVLAFLPAAASIALSATVAPVFLVRTLSAAAVPGFLLVAAGLAAPGPWRFAAAPFAACLLVSDLGVAWALAHRPPLQDWYGTIDWLKPRFRPGDVVWAYPNEGALPLAAALRDEHAALSVRPIPAPVPAFGSGGYFPTGSRGVVSLYPPQIAALMATPAARTPPTIWLLRLGALRYDPGDRMARALAADRMLVARFRSGQIDLIGLRRASVGEGMQRAGRLSE
ncbi:hypothetical protein [Sphingomonas sp.]|uniref:hypothetical protein n=1 Tax=Sphingomonas sp. TaxID=28214 RepID=UPI003B007275